MTLEKQRPLGNQLELINRTIIVLRWAHDQLAGTLIEDRNSLGIIMTKGMLSFPGGISQVDGDAICTAVNHLLVLTNVPGWVVFSCGEFFWQREQPAKWVDLIRQQDKERPVWA